MAAASHATRLREQLRSGHEGTLLIDEFSQIDTDTIQLPATLEKLSIRTPSSAWTPPG